MSIAGGVDVTGFIAPTSESDLYATHKAKYGHGSHRSVLDMTSRDDIKDRRREIGMTVYVESVDIIYILRGGIENNNFQVLIDLNNNTQNTNNGIPNNFETVYRNLNQYDYDVTLVNDSKIVKKYLIGESYIEAIIEFINDDTLLIKLLNTIDIDNIKTVTMSPTGMMVRYSRL